MAGVGAGIEAGIEAGKNSSAVNPQENLVLGSQRVLEAPIGERRHGVCAERSAEWSRCAESRVNAGTEGTIPRSPGPRIEAAPEERAVPWWLWWNILSLDAPMVAVAWAAVFAGAVGERLASADAAVLFLVVWAIYVCDRLLDGWIGLDRGELRARHFFCTRHRTTLVILVALAGGVVFWLAGEYLPAAERAAGVWLGAILLAYLVAIHFVRRRIFWGLPKEMVVGAVFAGGVALPVWSRSGELTLRGCAPWIFFGLLCALNCWCIECWEKHAEGEGLGGGRQHVTILPGAQLNRFAAGLAILAVVGGVAQGWRGFVGDEWVAIGLGALLLLALNAGREKLSAAGLRVLADAALLAPALAVLALRGVVA